MKKHLVPFLLIPFVLAGCDFKESLDNANNWVDEKMLSPVADSIFGNDDADNANKGEDVPEPVHTHTWSTTYSSNESYHWKTCAGCDEINGKGAHSCDTYSSDNYYHWKVCDTCGQQYAKAQHSGSRYYSDGEYHWKVCDTCGAIFGKTKHSSNTFTSNENEHWKVCDVCGAIFGLEEHHNCEGYKFDETSHWKVCEECGEVSSKEEHYSTSGYQTDGTYHWKVCDVCNERFAIEKHVSNVYLHDEHDHWKICEICGEEFDKSEHIGNEYHSDGENHWHVCEECGAEFDTVAHHSNTYLSDDEYHWKICDDCGEEFGKEQHVVSSWTTTKEPTLFDEGIREGDCDVCGRHIVEVVPHLRHSDRYIAYDGLVEFGSYPQSLVTDQNVLDLLSEYSFNSSSWNSYNYWVRNYQNRDIMSYKDVDLDSDGNPDYRGVYIKEYRDHHSSNAPTLDTCSQDELFDLQKEYWFKYEPLEWRVVGEPTSEKIELLSEKGIDSQYFTGYFQTKDIMFNHNGGSGYSNNYALSDVRLFLNDFFYNSAFNDEEKIMITSTLVENGTGTMRPAGEKYACENTTDNVFLLSYNEAVENNFNEGVYITDYAISQNAKTFTNDKASWLLRSPGNTHDEVDAIGYTSKSVRSCATFSSTRPAVNLYSLNPVKVAIRSENEEQGTVSNKSILGPAGSLVLVKAEAKPGYKFDGWYSNDVKVSSDASYQFELSNDHTELIAKFETRTDVPFTVEYYFQNAENQSQYDFGSSEIFKGVFNEHPVFDIKEFDNYSFDHADGLDDVVKADESTLVKVFYNREKFELSFNDSGDHGTVSASDGLSSGDKVIFGKSITLSNEADLGYHFDGWYIGENKVCEDEQYTFEMPAEDTLVEAKWAPNTDTPYTVNHYHVIDENNKVLLRSDTEKGTTDALTEAQYDEFEHVRPVSTQIEQKTIQANGETVVELNYVTSEHTLEFVSSHNDGINLDDPFNFGITYVKEYGEEITVEVNWDNKYDFLGWFVNGSNVPQSKNKEFTFEMPDEDITIELRFEYAAFKYTVNYCTETDTDGVYEKQYSEILTGVYGTAMTYNESAPFTGYTFAGTSNPGALVEDKTPDEQSIDVYYARNEHTLTVQVNDDRFGETSLGSNPVKMKYLKTFTITATEKNGAVFEGWYINNELKSRNKHYSSVMPDADLTIEARFSYPHVHSYDPETHLCTYPDDALDTGCGQFDPAYAMVTFTVNYQTVVGQNLFVCGLDGNWEPNQAKAMTWTEGHNWTIELPLKKGEEIEFKLIMIDGDGTHWEPLDGNRHYTPTNSVENVTLNWGYLN